MNGKVNWNENFKLRIANSDSSMQKHEIIKLLVMMKIIDKYKSNKNWIRVYSEFPLENGAIPDIYFEDIKAKAIICYEIQKELSNEYTRKKVEQYKNYEVPYMTCDLVIIPLKDAPTHISELNKWLDKYIY
jgi:hypothetical protein